MIFMSQHCLSVCILFTLALIPMHAQSTRMESLQLQSNGYRLTLQPGVLSGDVTLTLPSTTGILLTTEQAWLRGGSALLPSLSASLGSTDAADVDLVTAGTSRVHIAGQADAHQGNVGIGTTDPRTTLHVNGGVALVPPAVVDVDVQGTTITVGNNSFILVTNPVGGLVANAAAITLTDGAYPGHILILGYNQNNTQSVVVNSGGNISANNGNAVTLQNRVTVMYVWSGSVWRELSRSSNP